MFSVAAVALFCRSKDTRKYSYGVVGCKLSRSNAFRTIDGFKLIMARPHVAGEAV